MQAAIALALGGAAFVLTDVITFFATSDMAKDGQRNRKILAVLGIGGGLYLARTKPLLGLGLALGAGLAGFGNAIDLFVLQMLPAKAGGATALKQAGLGAVAYDNMRAVAYDNMRAVQYEGAPRMLGMGAVAYENMQGMGGYETLGEPVPPPPWESQNPYGN